RELRPLMGNWVYGCDLCQEVCPFQRFAQTTREPDFYPPDADRAAPPLVDLLALDEAGFRARFYGSPIYRIKRERLVRNACIATGNWGSPAAVPHLQALLDDASPLIRGHAAWALRRILGDTDAYAILARAAQHEPDALARAEMLP
ncbi:MAG: HEAT repeat domain-containing protein, partial [Anaerolineae bacterium]|nr:HEAT repeat domain-containing protein [Anaerolineae bacterium]